VDDERTSRCESLHRIAAFDEPIRQEPPILAGRASSCRC